MRSRPRRVDGLISIVIVKCRHGWGATLRFLDAHDDLILSHSHKQVLYWLIEQRVRW